MTDWLSSTIGKTIVTVAAVAFSVGGAAGTLFGSRDVERLNEEVSTLSKRITSINDEVEARVALVELQQARTPSPEDWRRLEDDVRSIFQILARLEERLEERTRD